MGSVSQAIWSDVFSLYMGIAIATGALVLGWLFYSMRTFRDRPGRFRPADAPHAGVVPRERGHVLWVYVMAGIMALVMFGLAFGTLGAVKILETPPTQADAVHVKVTGFQFGWIFEYDEGFQTINDFRVPVGRPVVLRITSQDVWHNFALPEYRIRIDAIPGETNVLWFQATEPASNLPIACVQICGTGHAFMKSTLTAMPAEAYDAWAAGKRPRAPGETAAARDGPVERAALLDATGITVDERSVPAGARIELSVSNHLQETFLVGVGPRDAPLATATLASGQHETLRFDAPASGALDLWSVVSETGETAGRAAWEVA